MNGNKAGPRERSFDKNALMPVVLLLSVCAIVLASGQATYTLGTLKALILLVTMFAALAFWMASSFFREGRFFLSPLLAAFAATIATALLPLLGSRAGYDVLPILTVLLADFILLLLVHGAFRTGPHLAVVPPFFLALLAALCVIGLFEKAGLIVPFGKVEEVSERILATMGNPDYLAGVLILCVPPGCGAAARLFLPWGNGGKRSVMRTAVGIAALAIWFCSTALLVLTASRAAWVGGAVSTLIFLLTVPRPHGGGGDETSAPRRRIRKAVFVALAILCVLLVCSAVVLSSPYLAQRIAQTLRSDNLDPGRLLASRLPIWKSAVSVWLSDPPFSILFGRGPGSYYALMFTHYPADFGLSFDMRSARHAHNEYLELLAESGVLGLAAWLAFCGIALFLCVKTLRARKAPLENRVLAAALFSSLCGSLVHALASVSHRTPGVYSVFLFIAGLSAVNASIAGVAPMRSVHLRKMPLRIAAGGLAMSAVLAALVYYSARPFAGEWRLLRAANAPDRLSAIRLIDSSLEANPSSVYALYDKLKLVLDSDPRGAIDLCGRIEALIPGYRRIDRYRGLALETLKDYPGAAGSFRRYIGMDSIEPSTYFHLAASLLMTGDGTGAAACMEDFFLAQHRKSMADRGRIMDLPRIRLVFTDAGESRTFDDEAAGERVCEVSRPFLTALVEALVREKNMGYYSVMLNLYMNVGRLFDEIRYGDLALVYYSMGVDSGMLPADELSFVYGRNRSFESRARELKAMAASSKNATDLYWADVWLATYLRNMNAIRFDEAMNREYEGLLREIEGLRYAKR